MWEQTREQVSFESIPENSDNSVNKNNINSVFYFQAVIGFSVR